MTPTFERRALQLAIAAACVVPILAGAYGITGGFSGTDASSATDSQIRYLSGLLLAIAVAFLWFSVRIEHHAAGIRLLTFIVVFGGLARLLTTRVTGIDAPTAYALVMELGIVPLLCLWQTRISRRVR